MRKIVLTLIALLSLGVSGAWGATPASTPTDGKYYYIYAQPTNPSAAGASNYYLYANSTNLKTTTYKGTNFTQFLWKCVANGDGTYDFQNASTNTYLAWGTMSASKFNWNLSATVTDTKANSLQSKNTTTNKDYWLVVYCTSSKSKDFDRNQNHGTSNTWTSDFVFVEYDVTRVTPEADKKYYLYCQNLASDKVTDLNQFIYDNSGSFGVATSKQVNNAYLWECVSNTSGTCVIKNVSTSKYLTYSSGPALSSSESSVIIENSAFANNAVTIRQNDSKNYYLIQNTGAPNHASRNFNKLTEAYCGDFVFLPVKTVTFSKAVSVNGGDAVSTIYVATDGSDVFKLDVNKYYTINEVGKYAADAATTIAAAGTSNISVTVDDLPTYTVTYTCENLSGYQLSSSTQDCAYFVPPTIEGYTVDGVYDDTDAKFDYEKTMITSATALKVVYRLTSNPFEDVKSTIASPTWYTMRLWCGFGNYMIYWDDTYVRHNNELSYPISDGALWCIEGNETAGYDIYNKKESKYLVKSNELVTGQVDNYYLGLSSSASTKWTLMYRDGYYELYSITDSKFVNRGSNRAHYWNTPIDKGGMTFDNALTLYQTNYPYTFIVNSAGCVDGYSTAEVDAAKTAVSNTEPTTVDNYAAFVTPLGTKLTLTSGNYYRIVSAVPGFSKSAAWYYNPSTSADYITWAKAATTSEHQVNSIFRITSNSTKWNIYSPNAELSIAASPYNVEGNGGWTAQSCVMAAAAGDVTIESIGSAQYTLKNYTQTMYCNGHSNGNGTSGTITNNNDNGVGGGSAWYLMPVSTISIPLNSVDSESYGTMCLPFGVTLGDGADAYYITIENGRAKAHLLSEKQIPSGVPVLLRSTTNAASVTATINDAATATTTGNKLVGTYTKLTSLPDGNKYILGNGDVGIGFYKLASGKVLGANKAYLNIDGVEVKSFALDFDGTDAIMNIIEGSSDQIIYDMSGRQVNKPVRGLYIVNGKKVIVK